MRFSVRVDTATPVHTTFTLFVNGGNAGMLCLRNDEFRYFLERLGIPEESGPARSNEEILADRERIARRYEAEEHERKMALRRHP